MSGCCDTGLDPLVPYEAALQNLLEQANTVTQTQTLSVADALSLVLAEDIKSAINVPPADNSAMDGYALRCADVQSAAPTRLKVTQRIAAGDTGQKVEAGTAARIFTGAPVPAGADAVIMQEQVECIDDQISFDVEVNEGQNIRKAGEDIQQHQVILKQGRKLRAQEMGLVASIGIPEITVYRKVKVGIFFTGDELVEPGQPLTPGKIYDSNRYTLLGLLQNMNCEVIDLGVVGDTLEQTKKAITQATEKADLVITSGGVSVGEEDHVRIALEQMGELFMWRLKIKPGKPLAFGKVNDTAFIGLPGNPVSAFTTFCLFVSPFIKKLQGQSDIQNTTQIVTSDFNWPSPDKRKEFVRARIEMDQNELPKANIYSHQGSGVLTSTSWADGFVIINENQAIKPGDKVEYLSFKELIG